MKHARGELFDSCAPERGRIVQQLCHHASRVGIARVLGLNEAELAALVDEYEIRVPSSQPRLAADDYTRAHPEI
jgi:hypothetical protein